MGAEIEAGVERRADRFADARMGMAVDAGRVFAEEIDIGMAVDIGDDGPFGARGANRHGRGIEDGAGIAAGHDPRGAVVHLLGFGAPAAEVREGLGQGLRARVGKIGHHIHRLILTAKFRVCHQVAGSATAITIVSPALMFLVTCPAPTVSSMRSTLPTGKRRVSPLLAPIWYSPWTVTKIMRRGAG